MLTVRSESTGGAITKSSIGLTADQVVLAIKAVVADGAVGQAVGAADYVGRLVQYAFKMLQCAAIMHPIGADCQLHPCLFDDATYGAAAIQAQSP